MINKLRRKLIISSMISLLIVLSVIIGTIAYLNYQKIIDDADQILEVLMANDGRFPLFNEAENSEKLMKKPPKELPGMSPELPYESRYFSVMLDEEGNVIFSDTGQIAAVDGETAISYAQAIFVDKQEGSGFYKGYRYLLMADDSGYRIIFLDCYRSLNSFKTLLLTSLAVSLLGFGAVLVLMIFLSGRIVKPFLENYEKQKRFITDAGHELKTPLTIIDTDIEVMKMDGIQNEWLEDIQQQTKRMAELTNNLILLAKLEETTEKLTMIEFPLSDVVEETFMSFQALAKAQDKKLNANIEKMVSYVGDENAIRHLVMILLDNAIKYSDEHGTIDLSLETQKNSIKLQVFNTTSKINRQDLNYLFDRFYRADRSRNSQTGGYGLGLSIALAIVNAHKAKIYTTSDDERSLKITVLFNT